MPHEENTVTIQRPVEAMYGESIIYDQAARLVRGEPLYQPLDQSPFTVAAYTPLYYAVVAGLQMLGLPGFSPGRVASFVAGLCAAVLVWQLTWRRTADQASRGVVLDGVLGKHVRPPGLVRAKSGHTSTMTGRIMGRRRVRS